MIGCPPGWFREREDGVKCIRCPAGFYSNFVGSETDARNEWPLRCAWCGFYDRSVSSFTYQDQVGSTRCKLCPLNTEVLRWP